MVRVVVIAVLVLGAPGTAGSAAQALPGGGQDDVLTGTADADVLRGGVGDDRMAGRGGPDRLSGGVGQDRLVGGRGGDVLRGGPGGDTLIPTVDEQVDRLIGGRGNDTAVALRNDQASMGGGIDYVLVVRPRPDMVVDCGSGDHDTASFQGSPPPGLVVEGCEDVVVLR